MSLTERDRRELSDLASSAADGRISPSDLARLEAVLLSSPEARAYYVRFMNVSAGLAYAAHTDLEAPQIAGKISGNVRAEHTTTRRRAWWTATAAVAALVVAVATTWALVKPPAPATNNLPTAAGIATLSTAMNVEWTDAQEPGHIGNMLQPGWVRIKSGLAQIDFLNGASVWLEGPVEFRLDSSREGYCASGKIVAQVPRAASDFRIASPYLSISDKGTGFGMEVSKGNRAAVHVFRGTVEVVAHDSRAKTELGPGQAMTIDHAGATSLMTADPVAFSREEFGGHWDSTRPYGAPAPWMYGWPAPAFDWSHGPYMGAPPVMSPGMWKGADPMDPVRDLLGTSDKRWAEIKKPLEEFLAEQWKSWGLDNNPEEKGVSRAKWDLKFAVEDPNSTDEEIAKRLQALRDAKSESRNKLESKELAIRNILTSDEQSRLTVTGYIP